MTTYTPSELRWLRMQKTDKKHLKPDGPFHIVGLTKREINLAWTRNELKKVINGWNDGLPIWEITENVERQEIETAFLVLELLELNILKPREGGCFGNEW